jgi:diguanylate cyclase (GGDEF)-like protein/PAS domain S-box-containing protein
VIRGSLLASEKDDRRANVRGLTRARSILLGLLFPALVTLLAVYGVSSFRANADERRRGQILLQQIIAATDRQDLLVSKMAGLGVVSTGSPHLAFELELSSLPDEVAALERSIDDHLTSLHLLSPPEPELRQVIEANGAYQSVVATQTQMLLAREFDDAWIFNRRRVEPASATLHGAVGDANDAYNYLAEESNTIATLGTIGVLGVMALVLAFFQFERNRRARALVESEARIFKDNEARFRALIQNSSDLVTVTSANLVSRYHSPAAEGLLGLAADEAAGKKLTDFVVESDLGTFEAMHQALMNDPKTSRSIECRLIRRDGTTRAVEVTATNCLDVPNVHGLIFNSRDISERKIAEGQRVALEKQLTHQAFHDPLTNLANRALFKDRVDHALARQSRTRESLAVLFLDLDNFKSINDTLGHEAGDSLLRSVAGRLQKCLRDADTIARMGGDEFAILLESIEVSADAYVVADRVVEALQMPFDLDGRHVLCGGSVGVAFGGSEDLESEDLLANADVAMYAAKDRGKGCWDAYRADMRRSLLHRMDLEENLQKAVEEQQFVVHYQPIVQVDGGLITGVEALVRWMHPNRGIVAPAEFIPLAEETGLIIPIGRWVLEQACAQVKQWQSQFLSETQLKVSVNLSVRQFQQANLLQDVTRVLDTTGLSPDSLILEITESILVHDSTAAVQKLKELKELGVQLALDDFGTGYSSLSYLRRFPIDVLKIDKSFIDDVHTDSEESALARAILQIGEALHLRTVAEGIELEEQAKELRALGCEEGQGYFFARPLEPGSIAALLAQVELRQNVEERVTSPA